MKRSSVLIAAAAGMIIGGITLGGVATANTGPTISGTVIANQGTGTGAGGAWKVDGSGVTQPVTGTVNVGNFPSTTPTLYRDGCDSYVSETQSTYYCTTTPATSMLIRDVGIYAQVPHGGPGPICQVIVVNDPFDSTYIPTVLQSSGGTDSYVGNSQVDLAVSAGEQVQTTCNNASVVYVTFQGDATS